MSHVWIDHASPNFPLENKIERSISRHDWNVRNVLALQVGKSRHVVTGIVSVVFIIFILILVYLVVVVAIISK